MFLLPFWALTGSVALLSMEGQKAHRFHKNYLKGAIGDCLQSSDVFFCYAGWKSLHIPIAIIMLSGLNVFIWIYIFVERIGPRNVCPIKTLVPKTPNIMRGFPTCLSMYVFAYLYAPCLRRQDTSSARSCTLCWVDRARMAGKHQQSDLPSWYCSTFTNCTIKFSHRWMTHNVA